MSGPILVVNPNSNDAVTAGMSKALAPFRLGGGPAIECVTLAEGPFGIESEVDAASVVAPLIRLVETRRDAAAIVIACFSDPGLEACRSVAAVPVLGIMEAGIMTGLARGDMVGIVALAAPSVARHRPAMRRMGVLDRLAGERAAGVSVAESATVEAFDKLLATARLLVEDGADSIVLGCAGMARHREELEAALARPVIDPAAAAVAIALGAVL